jgi:hypothetical protein
MAKDCLYLRLTLHSYILQFKKKYNLSQNEVDQLYAVIKEKEDAANA